MRSHGNKVLGLAGGAALVAAMMGFGAGSANAATDTATPHLATGYSCWYDGDTGQSLCVDKGVDLVAAVAEQDNVNLVIPDGTNIGGVKTNKARAAAVTPDSATTSYALSVIYDDANYGGSSYTISESNTCTQGYSYGFVDLNPIGWYGRVSSYHSYNGCKTAVFSGTNYTGSQNGYYANSANLGVMNDKAKSWRTAP